MRAVRKQHLWEAGSDLRAWLFTIMHNQHVNQVRRAIRDTAIDLETCSQTLVATTDPTASRQLYELDRALGQLADEQLEVIGGRSKNRCVLGGTLEPLTPNWIRHGDPILAGGGG